MKDVVTVPAPLRLTFATGLAVTLGLTAISLAGAVVVGAPPFCGWRGRIPRNVVERVAAAKQLSNAADPVLRRVSVDVLADYGSRCPRMQPELVSLLRSRLGDSAESVRLAAIGGLGAFGAEARGAIPDLEATKGKDIPYVDHVITEAVWSITNAQRTYYEEDGCEALTAVALTSTGAVNYTLIPPPRW